MAATAELGAIENGPVWHTFLRDLRNVVLLWVVGVVLTALGVLVMSGLPANTFPRLLFGLIFSPYLPSAFIFALVISAGIPGAH